MTVLVQTVCVIRPVIIVSPEELSLFEHSCAYMKRKWSSLAREHDIVGTDLHNIIINCLSDETLNRGPV